MFKNIVIEDVKDIFAVSSPKGRRDVITNRKCYGLSFANGGKITYVHNGKRTVSDKNHAVILPQGQTYTIFGNESGIFPVINFTCSDNLCDTIVSIDIQNNDSYLRDFEKLRSLSLIEHNRNEMLSVFYHILHKLSQQSTYCRTIEPAVKYIENNFSDSSLSNKKLSAMCCISEIYLRKLFVKHFNMTPKQFIIEIRINRAKQLLAEGSVKINFVAKECGFSNQYHFSRIFKEKTGYTPTDYMKQNRNFGF